MSFVRIHERRKSDNRFEVVFVMTGDCGDPTAPGYVAYKKIATTSSGQVFHLNKTDVDEVLDFVRESMQPSKVNLVSHEASEERKVDLKLNVDSSLDEFTVSVAGDKPTLSIVDPHGYRLERGTDFKVILHLDNVLVAKVKSPKPGEWTLDVGSDGEYTVRSTGLSEVNFEHGFSNGPVKSLAETHHRPLKGDANTLKNELHRIARS
ncbi:hemicentin-2-like [Ornithodoros turicata]|uniref:hemicentin-2-like n=1 Tax=Ornithodoros turicata TaxID=34597 RepID=UPI00313A335D